MVARVRRVVSCEPFDLTISLALQRLGLRDPSVQQQPHRFVKAFCFAGQPTVAAVEQVEDGLAIEGPEALVDAWAGGLPPDDGHAAFDPGGGPLRALHRRGYGLRLLRMPWLFDVAVSGVLQQRVTFHEAARQWARLLARHGVACDGLRALPPARDLARIGRPALEAIGIDPRRADAIIALAREEAFRHFLSLDESVDRIRQRLASLRGIGPWTVGMTVGFGAGDADAVITGDLHLPRIAARVLRGRPSGSDADLLESLEPFRGHRFRVTRLLLLAGR